MKYSFSIFLIFFCFILPLTACQNIQEPIPEPTAPAPEVTEQEPEPDPTLSQRDRDWIEDIEYLRTEYKAKHLDPFYLCSEEEVDWRLDQIIANVSKLSDTDIFFEINSFIARMGDPHTTVAPAEFVYERRFPVTASYFDGKLYLTAYLDGYEDIAPYLLREIVAINGVDIAYINQKVDCTCNYFNTWTNQALFQTGYFLPAFFDWAGCDYKANYTFQILNENQEVESVEIPVVTSDTYNTGKWVYPKNWESLIYQKQATLADYVDGENGGLVYMSLTQLFHSVSDTGSKWPLAIKVNKLFEEHPDCDKLVVDLRFCPGGDAGTVERLQENIELIRTEHVYVLTSGWSLSAATTLMRFFKQELNAVFVGEPTGQFISMFHRSSILVEPAVLPHSQIRIRISDNWWDGSKWWDGEKYSDVEPLLEEYYDENGKLYPWESGILPDVYVHQDIEDIRQGKDSVLKWVLAQ